MTTPYYIIITHPDYKRPYVSVDNYICDEKELNNIRSHILNALIDNVYDPKYNDEETYYNELIDNWHCDGYMDQECFEAHYFFDGKWNKLEYTEKEFDGIINKKRMEYKTNNSAEGNEV